MECMQVKANTVSVGHVGSHNPKKRLRKDYEDCVVRGGRQNRGGEASGTTAFAGKTARGSAVSKKLPERNSRPRVNCDAKKRRQGDVFNGDRPLINPETSDIGVRGNSKGQIDSMQKPKENVGGGAVPFHKKKTETVLCLRTSYVRA